MPQRHAYGQCWHLFLSSVGVKLMAGLKMSLIMLLSCFMYDSETVAMSLIGS